ncbi:MAG: hypothetical protein HRT58_02530 [Crocinitomicaceae bacterium]|nr:hypothetical protein [Flavobacteriales bacterium]NQZ34505.1 hypothetical protein [Crocinitomicaceae bacterium]
MSLLDALALGNKALLLINIFYLIFLIKHLRRSMILLMVLLVGILFIDLASSYLSDQHISNIHLTHYYTIGQFFILSVIYYKHLKKFQLIVPFGVALFSSILIYQLVASKIVYNELNISGFIASACVLMTYAFFYFIEHISEKRYWDTFNVGLFLYLGGSSIIFLTMNSWQDLEDWNVIIWTVNASLAVLFQVFITTTIYRFHLVQKNQNGISSL